jgi:iron complex outermembrane recepter protein
MSFKPSALSAAVQLLLGTAGLGLSATSFAQDEGASELPVIQVTALSIDESASKIVAPFNLLDKEQIFNRGGSLGDLLNGLPGVHSDSFGGGASRPVIRGQTSPRVRVLSDSATLFDASDISPDHAVVADPLLARRIEVLRGPATLLYGGGAVGGVVNVLDDKIATSLPQKALEGSLALRGNTVADERAAAVSANALLGSNLVLHLEGSRRETDNYKAKGWNESRVDNTFSDSDNAALGLSWVGDQGYLGVAYSYRNDNYGIPGHSHEYEGCHPHGAALHCGSHDDHDDDHDHDDHEDEMGPWIGLDTKRTDLRGELRNPLPGIHRIRVRGSHTDYSHDEIEEGMPVTNYGNRSWEGRIEVDHVEILGWHGVVGTQFSDTRFTAAGAEAYLPATDSSMQSLFAVEHYDFNDEWHLEAGIRHERQQHSPVNDPRNRPAFDSSSLSMSGAVIWTFSEEYTLSATLAEAQRLPHAQELYARGVHLATNTFECGLIRHPLTCGGAANNQELARETSRNLDLALNKHSGNLTYSVNFYRNQVDNYIYARTLDQVEDFRLIKYTQKDSTFTGLELEAGYAFSDQLSATAFGDYVRATFEDGSGKLPRVSPRRYGVRTNLLVAGINTELELLHVERQNRIAAYETATPGYNMLNLTVGYSPDNQPYSLFLRASNLLDDEVWSHTSFLANVIPMQGRNISAGLRYNF